MKQNNQNIDELLTTLMGGHAKINDPGDSAVEDICFDDKRAYQQFRTKTSRPESKAAIPHLHWLKYTAAIAGLIIIALLAHWEGQHHVTSNFADIVVEAPLGATTRLTLPDGSAVWLNAGSRLIYSQGFGIDQRIVSLSGEGYFEVTHHKDHPFEVKSQELKVRVLGTKFNLSNYDDESTAIVSLLEGSVAIDNLIKAKTETIRLAPNERCTLDKETGEMKLERNIVANNARVWTSGQLFFDEEPLADIVRTLEHSYNIKIHIENPSLEDFRFYGEFARREQSITEVLETLSATGKLRYRIDGANVFLY